MPATKTPSAVPAGFRTVTPALIVDDAKAALAFYGKALGAKERQVDLGPGGRVWHAEIQVGDSIVMVSDEFPEMGSKSAKSLGGTSVGMWVYVDDADALYHRAIAAGAKSLMPPADQFWGDRMAAFEDPFRHRWTVATHKEDVAPAEMERRRAEAARQFASGNR